MPRPRILLVPEFTELTWTIKPALEEWADVASFDPPGIGAEPGTVGRESVIRRGLRMLDELGWEEYFLAADFWGNASAIAIAADRPAAVRGLALGHATLSFRRAGARPPINAEVHAALSQLILQDAESFIRHGIVQATQGSVDEELAGRMVERFPKDSMEAGWDALTEELDFEEEFRSLAVDTPLLLGRHHECLMSTEEGFEDAAVAFPDALTVITPQACCAAPDFAVSMRALCDEAYTA